MEYWLITTGPASQPGIDAGLGRRIEPGWGTLNTIGVDSLEAHLEKVVACGARIVHLKSTVPGVGWLADCQEPEGSHFGLRQDDLAAP